MKKSNREVKERKITRFYKEVPECDEKAWKCGHQSCKLWSEGYGVSMRKFLFIKWLVWEAPTVV